MENTPCPVAPASNPLAYLTRLVAGSQRLLCANPIEQMELANAALDPVGQVYPWLDFYPLVGQT
ncbi:MAG TPA: hypothetical protein VFD36_10450, partial [Kofleriaceae bacterium]|nr:hypothetical protein [Kofleriaceae bacterium]